MMKIAPSTCDISDTSGDSARVLDPVFRDYGGREAFHGPIITVKCFEDNSKVKQFAGEAGQGRVMVVDGGGSLRRALLGDMIAAKAAENGWAGLVIHGAVRDVEILQTLALGVKALAACPVKTEKRDLGDVGVPVTFAGCTIRTGDYLYADANGVLVLDAALV